VQHDGERWLCLVAGPLAVIRKRDFAMALPPRIHLPTALENRRGTGSPAGDLFRLRMHGCMEQSAGTPGFPGHFINRFTCANLAVAGDDFVCQYFQVVDGLIIY
jgi:hypothetical protein